MVNLLFGFELLTERELPELRSHARLFRHVKSGARLLSIENEDENKVFGINFRTPPPDSTGLPHIMEHAVLCGSKRFPLREPFVELLKGSLKTFVNAFTFPDKTGYPVASQNTQDFYNLIDVYMDAVLYPLIPPHTLQQEGWHYEMDSLDGELNFKGVVFNEMKGAYSSPDSLLAQYSQQYLFPEHVYGLDSGGDPSVIPDLTYEQFKQFHETYYHPSNSYIVFYGDDDPDQRLRLMDSYLKDFSEVLFRDAQTVNRKMRKSTSDSSIPKMARWSEPRRIIKPYDFAEGPGGTDAVTNRCFLTVNWLLDEPHLPVRPQKMRQSTAGTSEGSKPYTLGLALTILEHILIGTTASPLRKALIDSGLGEDLAGGGLQNDLREWMFSTGLKGMAKQSAEQVEKLIFETLSGLAQEGIDPETVAASLNTIEFRLRENNTGSFPRGIVLMLRSLTGWLYDGDPLAPLAFEAPLQDLKNSLAAGIRLFEDLIQQYFLDNPHRTVLLLEPDPTLRQLEEQAERERLDQARARMTPDDLKRIVEDTRKLKLLQETPDSPEALAAIPTLKLADLDPQVRTIPCQEITWGGMWHRMPRTLFHDLFTNGILYLDLGFDLHRLSQEYLPMVPLFGRALLEMGTEKEDFVQLSQRIGSETGGIRAVPLISAVLGRKESAAWMFLRGKAIASQAEDLFSILSDVILTARFDQPDRFRQIVLEEKSDQEAMLVPAGHQVVNARVRAQFTEADWASEQMGGVSYLFFLRRLVERIDQDWQSVLAQLEEMREILVNRKYLLSNVTLDANQWIAVQPQLVQFLNTLPARDGNMWDKNFQDDFCAWTPPQGISYEGLTIPAKVNYVGKGANLYDLGYALDGSILVIRNTLRTTWLWEKVRVQGGAYGGMCAFDTRSGVFTYLSYRDPNLLKTLEIYDQTAEFLRNLDLSQEELVKTIIGAIGEMDAYQLPDAKGFTSMVRQLVGETDAFRQEMRQSLLGATKEDYLRFADVLEALSRSGKVVAMGSLEALEAANKELAISLQEAGGTGKKSAEGLVQSCFEITKVL